MPMRPGSRGSSTWSPPDRVSWRRIVRTDGNLRKVRGAWARDRRPGRWRPQRPLGWPAMPGAGAPGERLALVEHAFRTLPERYLGAPAGFDTVYQVRLGDVGRTWEVHCTETAARVRRGAT